jgi:hypothetical protein
MRTSISGITAPTNVLDGETTLAYVMLKRWPKNEIDNIADILFVGHAFEAFFRESDDGA